MAVCVAPNSSGFLAVTGQTLEECQTFVLVSQTDYLQWLDASSVTLPEMSAALGFGVTIIVGWGYFGTYAISAIQKLIKLM